MSLMNERRYEEVEKELKDILRNSDKDIRVHIHIEDFFIKPLKDRGFSEEEVVYTLRGLTDRGYFKQIALDNVDGILMLSQLGRDEWVFPTLNNKIFLSYADEDKVLAGEIKRELEKNGGFDVFLAHETIQISKEWKQEIFKKIKESTYFIALRTKNFKGKPTPEQECGMALAYDKKIVVLKIDTEDKEHGFLQFYQRMEFNINDIENDCEKLIIKLKNIN